jgi:spore germination protein YaaH
MAARDLSICDAGYGVYTYIQDNKETQVNQLVEEETYSDSTDKPEINNLPNKTNISREAVFVPYWADMSDLANQPERLLYFGISPDENGINTGEPGYQNLDSFITNRGSKETYLTVRMLDNEITTPLLKNRDRWQPLAKEITNLASENGFDGVVLDLEVGLLALQISPESITGFTQTLKDELEIKDLPLAMTLYGDTFFRKRPYDIKKLGAVVDEVMIMAYDFHKSFGSAGPNFPLNGREEYRYDFTTMVQDFTKIVPAEKITVIFGMYGYEWNVDEQERPLKSAEAITLNQINKRYFPNCTKANCKVERDETSAEMQISFSDNGRTRRIWYEDEKSVDTKQKLLEEKGISSVGFWAYGYY